MLLCFLEVWGLWMLVVLTVAWIVTIRMCDGVKKWGQGEMSVGFIVMCLRRNEHFNLFSWSEWDTGVISEYYIKACEFAVTFRDKGLWKNGHISVQMPRFILPTMNFCIINVYSHNFVVCGVRCQLNLPFSVQERVNPMIDTLNVT